MDHQPLRVVLVDDHEIVRCGLRAMLLAFADRVRVEGEAASADEAMALVPRIAPDVVLCDIRLRDATGLDLCRLLVERSPGTRVVLLTVYDDEQYLYQALRNGASGYLLKRIEGDELVRNLELVHAGETVVDPTLGARAAGAAARAPSSSSWPGSSRGLTRREGEVLGFMTRGMSNQEIARHLVVGAETVKSHVRAVYRKLGVSSRAAAVGAATADGLPT